MHNILATAALVLTVALPVHAAESIFGAPLMVAANSQQDRMKTCNADAKTKALAGAERKAFMKTCLGGGAAEKASTPQNRMKSCNKDAGAKGLKGEDRKQFMSGCLKG